MLNKALYALASSRLISTSRPGFYIGVAGEKALRRSEKVLDLI